MGAQAPGGDSAGAVRLASSPSAGATLAAIREASPFPNLLLNSFYILQGAEQTHNQKRQKGSVKENYGIS